MRSGIGVGGYCLTKDPLFAKASSEQVLHQKFEFPLSSKAVEVNQKMTFDVMSELKNRFNKKIFGKKFCLLELVIEKIQMIQDILLQRVFLIFLEK